MTAVRNRTPSREIESAVVEAALRLLADDGPAALTVRGLAAEAGIAPMGIYNHFGDKNGVIDIVWRRGFEELTRSVSIALELDDPIEGLRAGLMAYRRFALDHRTTYAVMFLREVPNFTPSDESLVIAAESFEVLIRGVERTIRAGELHHGDPREIAQQLWAATHGAVALEIADMCLVDDMAQTYQRLVATMITGLRPVRAAGASRGAHRTRAR
jgi:AcrR family transcriptional regulator